MNKSAKAGNYKNGWRKRKLQLLKKIEANTIKQIGVNEMKREQYLGKLIKLKLIKLNSTIES